MMIGLKRGPANLPLERVDVHFELAPAGGQTIVRLTPDYVVKFGLMGRLLDRIYVRQSYRRGMLALLAGLKTAVAAGAGSRQPNQPAAAMS